MNLQQTQNCLKSFYKIKRNFKNMLYTFQAIFIFTFEPV